MPYSPLEGIGPSRLDNEKLWDCMVLATKNKNKKSNNSFFIIRNFS